MPHCLTSHQFQTKWKLFSTKTLTPLINIPHPLKTYEEMHFFLILITNIFTLATNFKLNILYFPNIFIIATNFKINILYSLNGNFLSQISDKNTR